MPSPNAAAPAATKGTPNAVPPAAPAAAPLAAPPGADAIATLLTLANAALACAGSDEAALAVGAAALLATDAVVPAPKLKLTWFVLARTVPVWSVNLW